MYGDSNVYYKVAVIFSVVVGLIVASCVSMITGILMIISHIVLTVILTFFDHRITNHVMENGDIITEERK